ncbi:MAG: hypothetical protein U1F33_12350 [Alphaproteobacteria bacterium]
MRSRFLLMLAPFAFGLAVLPATSATAAPQILALIATDGPVALDCDGANCAAILSSICLQRDRTPPPGGTVYEPAGLDNLKLVATSATGATREISARGHVRIESARSFLGVRVTVPAEIKDQLGAQRLAIAVGPGVSLMPRAVVGDPNPLTAAEVAHVTGPARDQVAWIDDPRQPGTGVARLATRMLNLLPSGRTVSQDDAMRAYRQVMAGNQAHAGADQFAALFNQCKEQRGWTAYGRNLRECVEFWHDTYMTEVNVQVWQTIGAGS